MFKLRSAELYDSAPADFIAESGMACRIGIIDQIPIEI